MPPGKRFVARRLAVREKSSYHGDVERIFRLPRVAPVRRSLPRTLVILMTLYAAPGFTRVAAAQDRLKVAVVDVAKVFGGYFKTKEVEKTVNEARGAAKRKFDTRVETHHRLVEEIARLDKELDNPALGAPAKADLQKQRGDKAREIRTLEEETKEFRAGQDRSLQELTIRLRNQVVEDILTVVRARVERDHYDLILNKSAQGVNARTLVLSANPSLEITDDVLTTLNNHRPGATPLPSPEP